MFCDKGFRIRMSKRATISVILGVAGLCLAGQISLNAQEVREGEFTFVPDEVKTSAAALSAEINKGIPESFLIDSLLEPIGAAAADVQHMGWFTYGDHRSRSVVAVILKASPETLYLDIDRDRTIEPSEASVFAGNGAASWDVDLDAEYLKSDGTAINQPQRVRINIGADGSLCTRTAGIMEGRVDVDGHQRLARRMDRDNNGRWFDPEDRVLIDLNGDQRLDSILERFACEGIQIKGSNQYVIVGDSAGKSLRLEPVRDRGSIVPQLSLTSPDAKILQVEASIGSESGVHIPVTELSKAIEVPIGNYHVERLRIKVQDASGTYWFAFNRGTESRSPVPIEKDQSAVIELLGPVRLKAKTETVDSGESLTRVVTPLLLSDSGLFLAGSRKGAVEAVEENRLIARSLHQGKEVHVGTSGFS